MYLHFQLFMVIQHVLKFMKGNTESSCILNSMCIILDTVRTVHTTFVPDTVKSAKV
jgi:hypothetical protein